MSKNILILAGPSAVGKTTVAHALLDLSDKFDFVRSVTTRKKRGDAFDNEYLYISREEFLHLIETKGVLEHTEYGGELYGTPRSEIDRITEEGRIPLLVLDMNGVRSLFKNKGDINACGVYVYDELDVMKRRLEERYLGEGNGEGSEAKMRARHEQNVRDYLAFSDYEPYFYSLVLNNGTLDECIAKVEATFADFACGVAKDTEKTATLAKHLKDSASGR